MFFLTSILILIDQISKYLIRINLYDKSINIIPHLLKFTYVENRGALFGIGQNSTLFFIIFSIIIIGAIIAISIMQRNNLNKLEKISLCLILSGGIGNLIDRIFFGFVTDFLDISPFFDWPVFNIADIYVVSGCVLLVFAIFKSNKYHTNK